MLRGANQIPYDLFRSDCSRSIGSYDDPSHLAMTPDLLCLHRLLEGWIFRHLKLLLQSHIEFNRSYVVSFNVFANLPLNLKHCH